LPLPPACLPTLYKDEETFERAYLESALRRSGVGREAASQVIALFPGPWSVGFQSYNRGVQRFWSQVASDAVGDKWATHDDPPVAGRPPDSWITFTT